jgi:diguanylate cyclase (GGDEF)-like protein
LEDGTSLMRWPYLADYFGGDQSSSPLFRAFSLQADKITGSLRATSRVDKIERFISYQRLGDYPIVATTGIWVERFFADWRTDLYLHILACILVLGLIWRIAWGFAQQALMREKAEKELLHANDELRRLSSHDALTGLTNRRQLDATLVNELRRAKRDHTSLALIMIDVDHFKLFNDTYGHLAGDECLKRVAHTLTEITAQRAGDVAARFGGEEFVVLLSGAGVDDAVAVAEKLRLAVQHLNIPHTGGVLTISAGVCVLKNVTLDNNADQLISGADQALYAAKNKGRNCVCLHPLDLAQQGRVSPRAA